MSWRGSDRAWLLQDQHPEGATTMTQYVGLDVSMRETKLHVLDDADKRVWRDRCATEPAAIAAAVRRYAPTAVRIGLETGPLTTWLWTALTADRRSYHATSSSPTDGAEQVRRAWWPFHLRPSTC